MHPSRLTDTSSAAWTQRLTRRHFLAWAGAAALLLPSFRWPSAAASLAPGEPAPEDWGGVGLYDAVTAYIDCDGVPSTDPEFPQQFFAFRGQVVFLRSEADRHTVVLVAGQGERGPVLGYRVFAPVGLDQPVWSTRELNISLGGGGGGAQLRYDRETGRINLFLAGFVVVFPDGVERRIGLVAEMQADRDPTTGKSRVLDQPLGPTDAVQYYLRAGTTPLENTRLLAFAHLSVRAPLRLPSWSLDQPFPVAFPTLTRQPDRLTVTETTGRGPAVSTVWEGGAAPVLRAPTTITTVSLRQDGLAYPLPASLEVELGAERRLRVDTLPVQPADTTVVGQVAPYGAVLHPRPCLATLPLLGDGYLMTQTVGGSEVFLPLLNQGESARGEDRDKW